MNKKGFMFSQNLMDELGSLQGEVNSYSSQNSWTDSQSVDSQESGYQTSDYLPDSFLPRRSRPTLPRPPSCPTFATSQPPPIQSKFSASNRQENNPRWKFLPVTGTSAKKGEAVERDLKNHLEIVKKDISMIPSSISKLLEEAVTYLDNNITLMENNRLDTIPAINEIKHTLEEFKRVQVNEITKLQKEKDEENVLDNINKVCLDVLAHVQKQENSTIDIEHFVKNPEKEQELLELNKLIVLLDSLIKGFGPAESSRTNHMLNLNSELKSNFEKHDKSMKQHFQNLTNKLSGFLEGLKETEDLISQLPILIKDVVKEEIHQSQTGSLSNKRQFSLDITGLTSTPKIKRRATSTLYDHVPLPLPTIKTNGNTQLSKNENYKNMDMDDAIQVGKKGYSNNNTDDAVVPIFSHEESEDDLDFKSNDENEIEAIIFSLSDSF